MSIPFLFRALLATCALALLSACAQQPRHPSLAGGELPPLVPVRSFAANLDGNGAYQLSPDGRRLAWLARAGLGPGVFIKNLDSGEQRLVLEGSAELIWAEDGTTLLLQASLGGEEELRVLALDTRRPDAPLQDLTPFPGRISYLHEQGRLRGSPDLLIASNKRDPKVFDLYRRAPSPGGMALVAQNPGNVRDWILDAEGRLVGRTRRSGDSTALERPAARPDGAWTQAFSWNLLESVRILSVPANSATAWALSNRSRDKIALVRLNLDSGQESVVFEDPRVDLSGVLMSPDQDRPLMAWYQPDHPAHVFFDERLGAAVRGLLAGRNGGFVPRAQSNDGRHVLGQLTHAQGGETVLLDLAEGKHTVLGETLRGLLNRVSPLPEQRPITLISRDGLPLHGYLTLPFGVIARRLPAVMLVHGGPWSRDHWGESPEATFLANRGYAVLQLNFRGSTGYGRAFLDRGIGELAGKMHEDVLDGADWLVAQGIADPARLAIAGASYGGYQALVGASFSPDRFACAVALSAPTDLARLVETAPAHWELDLYRWHRFAGDPAKPAERARMDAKSPLYRASAVTAPVLLMHGVHDSRVKLDQAERMVRALRQAGKSVEYVVFKREGHDLQHWSSRLRYYRKVEDFLAQCLGGRSSGFDLFELASWAF